MILEDKLVEVLKMWKGICAMRIWMEEKQGKTWYDSKTKQVSAEDSAMHEHQTQHNTNAIIVCFTQSRFAFYTNSMLGKEHT